MIGTRFYDYGDGHGCIVTHGINGFLNGGEVACTVLSHDKGSLGCRRGDSLKSTCHNHHKHGCALENLFHVKVNVLVI